MRASSSAALTDAPAKSQWLLANYAASYDITTRSSCTPAAEACARRSKTVARRVLKAPDRDCFFFRKAMCRSSQGRVCGGRRCVYTSVAYRDPCWLSHRAVRTREHFAPSVVTGGGGGVDRVRRQYTAKRRERERERECSIAKCSTKCDSVTYAFHCLSVCRWSGLATSECCREGGRLLRRREPRVYSPRTVRLGCPRPKPLLSHHPQTTGPNLPFQDRSCLLA